MLMYLPGAVWQPNDGKPITTQLNEIESSRVLTLLRLLKRNTKVKGTTKKSVGG